MLQLDAGELLEVFTRHVTGRAHARRAERDGMLLRILHQFLEVPGRKVRAHRKRGDAIAHVGNRLEGFERIELHRHKLRRDCQIADRRVEQRVAIGLGLGDELRTNRAARARLVIQNHRLPRTRRHLVRNQPRDVVVGAAGGVGNDQRDRLGRPSRVR